MNRGDVVYYTHILDDMGIYECIRLTVKKADKDYFIGVSDDRVHSYIFPNDVVGRLVFKNEQEAYRIVFNASEGKGYSPVFMEDFQ